MLTCLGPAGPAVAGPAGAGRAVAGSATSSPCNDAILKAEKVARLPTKLLGAIGMVESGRLDPVAHRFVPWPWTINVEGTGYFYETREEAIAAVVGARASGRQSIDVGCMQINLLHHPQAFASLEQAFDPDANATYAAGFMLRLFQQTGDWGSAAAAYHSQTPGVADDYRRRVVGQWSNAAVYGVTADTASGGLEGSAARHPEPLGGYTTEFRARLVRDAEDRQSLLHSVGRLMTTPLQSPRRTAARHSPHAPT